MAAQLAAGMFHRSDIRADASLFTPETVTRLTHAEALYFRKNKIKSVVLARDARLSGAAILSLTADILISLGFDVHVITTPASTPYFYHTVKRIPGAAGIMITASHNPGSYNGEKLVSPGPFPIADQTGLEKIKEYFINNENAEQTHPGRVFFPDFSENYITSSFSFLSLERSFNPSFRFAADFLTGAASDGIAPVLSLMENVRLSHFVPDGRFPLGDPNPAKVKMLPLEGEEFILLYDGDGDRVDIVLRDGREIPPSVIFAFILSSLAPRYCRVGLDPKVSPVIRKYLKEKGYEPVLVPNGHSRIKGMMGNDEMLMAAAEESGHFYMSIDGIPTENTLIITLAFLSCFEKNRKGLEDLISLSSSFVRIREWTDVFECDEKRRDVLMKLTKRFVNEGYLLTDTLENGEALGTSLLIKTDEGGWSQVSLRASDTEEGLVRYEVLASDGKRAEEAHDIIKEYSSKG